MRNSKPKHFIIASSCLILSITSTKRRNTNQKDVFLLPKQQNYNTNTSDIYPLNYLPSTSTSTNHCLNDAQIEESQANPFHTNNISQNNLFPRKKGSINSQPNKTVEKVIITNKKINRLFYSYNKVFLQ